MQNYHHDQSTVASNNHLHEKLTEPNDSGNGYTSSAPKSGLGKFTTNFTLQCILRSLQVINSITLLGLSCSSLNKFYEGEPRMRFTVFCASFALFYLGIHMILTFAAPQFALSGVIAICELTLTVFNLSAFIAIASRYSGYTCSYQQFDQYGYRYNTDVSIPGCHSAKAAIAFAAFGFLLFALSLMAFGYNVLKRKYSEFSTSYGSLFKHTTAISGRYFVNYPFMDFREQTGAESTFTDDQHTEINSAGDLENQTGQYAHNNNNIGVTDTTELPIDNTGVNCASNTNYVRPEGVPEEYIIEKSKYTGATSGIGSNTSNNEGTCGVQQTSDAAGYSSDVVNTESGQISKHESEKGVYAERVQEMRQSGISGV